MSQRLRRAFPIAIASGVIALHCAWPLQAQTRDSIKWRVFESAEGRFKVAFPGDPVTKRGKFRTEIGDVLSTRYTTGDGADATYDVRHSDYPKAGITRLSVIPAPGELSCGRAASEHRAGGGTRPDSMDLRAMPAYGL